MLIQIRFPCYSVVGDPSHIRLKSKINTHRSSLYLDMLNCNLCFGNNEAALLCRNVLNSIDIPYLLIFWSGKVMDQSHISKQKKLTLYLGTTPFHPVVWFCRIMQKCTTAYINNVVKNSYKTLHACFMKKILKLYLRFSLCSCSYYNFHCFCFHFLLMLISLST